MVMLNSTFKEVTDLYANSSFNWGNGKNDTTKLYANNSSGLSNSTSSTQLIWMSRFLLCEQDPEIPAATEQETYLDTVVKDERMSGSSNDSKEDVSYDNTTSMYCVGKLRT